MKAVSPWKIEEKIFFFIEKNRLIEKGDSILIGFSGGADSSFVLYFLNKYAAKYKIKIAAVHVNHSLRGEEAERDEKFCKRIAEETGIELFVKRVDVKEFSRKNKYSIEEAARILRYDVFEKIAEKEDFSKICTAHNMNDNSETILLNLFKGTGTVGLSGISPKRDKIIRPILAVTRDEIESYLKSHNIPFITDSSNADVNFLRNKIRHDILPVIRNGINPNVDKAILNLSGIMLKRNLFIKKYAADLRINLLSEKNGELILNISRLDSDSFLLLDEILRPKLENIFSFTPEYQDIEKIESLIKARKGTAVTFRNRLQGIREENEIVFYRPDRELETKEIIFKLGENVKNKEIELVFKSDLSRESGCEIISLDDCGETFILRKWKSGDKFQPLGMRKNKKISDFLTDIKVPSRNRNKIYVLENRREIIWVVGYRISDKVKIKNNSRKKVKLCVKKMM